MATSDFTEQEIEVMLLRDTHHIHKPRHRRSEAKWRRMIQYRGICGCCKADPVVVSLVKERGVQKRLCLACYESALDLVREAIPARL
jgi:hypothetical protein